MKPLTLTDGAYHVLLARFTSALTRGNFAFADSLIPRITRIAERATRADNASYRARRAVTTRTAPHEWRGY